MLGCVWEQESATFAPTKATHVRDTVTGCVLASIVVTPGSGEGQRMECLANGTMRLRHTTVQSRTCSPHHTWGALQGVQAGCCTHHNSRALPTGEGDLNTKHSIIGQGSGTYSHCTGIHLCVCVCRGGCARILRIE